MAGRIPHRQAGDPEGSCSRPRSEADWGVGSFGVSGTEPLSSAGALMSLRQPNADHHTSRAVLGCA